MTSTAFKRVGYYLTIVFACLSFMSCTSLKQPTFLNIDIPKVIKANEDGVTIMSSARFNNPNKTSMSLKEMKIEMSSNNNVLGSFLQNLESRIEGMSDFEVPFTITFNPKQLGKNLLQTALSVLVDRKLKVKFRGYAKIGGKRRGFKIPLFYNRTIKLN